VSERPNAWSAACAECRARVERGAGTLVSKLYAGRRSGHAVVCGRDACRAVHGLPPRPDHADAMARAASERGRRKRIVVSVPEDDAACGACGAYPVGGVQVRREVQGPGGWIIVGQVAVCGACAQAVHEAMNWRLVFPDRVILVEREVVS
jgi:hypothetical protein